MLFAARVVAADECVDGRELVDEAVLEQELERAVDRRRRRGTVGLLHQVEQLVGLHRAVGGGDQSQCVRTDRGQPQPARLAHPLHLADETFGVVDVVLSPPVKPAVSPPSTVAS